MVRSNGRLRSWELCISCPFLSLDFSEAMRWVGPSHMVQCLLSGSKEGQLTDTSKAVRHNNISLFTVTVQKSWVVEGGLLYMFTPFPCKLMPKSLTWMYASECAKEILDCQVFSRRLFYLEDGSLTNWPISCFLRYLQGLSKGIGVILDSQQLFTLIRYPLGLVLLSLSFSVSLALSSCYFCDSAWESSDTWWRPVCEEHPSSLNSSYKQLPQGQLHPLEQSAQHSVIIS